MKKGIAYGVGVGPGDPELMTLKAVRLLRENDVIAVPGANARESVAYRIAVQNVPELAHKTLVPLELPMCRDTAALRTEHRRCADTIEAYLEQGKNVVYITLGDPTIYCTFSYIQHILETDGYTVELVSGVTSFCAAAARANRPLAEGDEQLHILPAVHMSAEDLAYPGNYVLMKSASRMKTVKALLHRSGKTVCAVRNCGMPDEQFYRDLAEIPDDAGYFTLLLAR